LSCCEALKSCPEKYQGSFVEMKGLTYYQFLSQLLKELPEVSRQQSPPSAGR